MQFLYQRKADICLLGHLGSLEGANLIQGTAQRFQSISGRAGALLLRGGLSPFPGNLYLLFICANHLLSSVMVSYSPCP